MVTARRQQWQQWRCGSSEQGLPTGSYGDAGGEGGLSRDRLQAAAVVSVAGGGGEQPVVSGDCP